MISKVFLSDDFLSHLVNKFNDLNIKITDVEIPSNKLNYQKIKQIISKSNLYLPYTGKEVVELIRKNENPIKTMFLNSLIKNTSNKYYDQKADFSNSSTVYFVGDENCTNISINHNVLCKGSNYNFEGDFFKSPLRTIFDKNMDSDDNSNTFHYCKNIILIDPYLFSAGFKKQQSLINFLDTCFNYKNENADKNLTLITEFPTKGGDCVKNKILNNYLINLSVKLKIKKENITLLRHVGNEFQGNRHLITDYALMDLQHVFDRDDGVVTGLYFYNENIENNFEQANVLISKIKDLYNVTNEEYSEAADTALRHNKLKLGNILNNPLFN
ncbi:MAG: hypothetical protein ACI8ZX_002526 [Planctomycetota bacterium]|jgi:hypothetical protein